jgi:hypothetical protein
MAFLLFTFAGLDPAILFVPPEKDARVKPAQGERWGAGSKQNPARIAPRGAVSRNR